MNLDKIIKLIGAKGGVIRVADEKHERLKVVSAQGVSQSFLADETYLDVGVCFCGEIAKEGISANADLTVPLNKPMLHSCSKEGFKSVVSINEPLRYFVIKSFEDRELLNIKSSKDS